MMKNSIAMSLCAFLLLSVGASLAQQNNIDSNNLWSSLIMGIDAIWMPFLFAYFIVGFGTWTLQRLYRKEE